MSARKGKALLIIDPALRTPECAAINLIMKFLSDFQQRGEFPLRYPALVMPGLTGLPLSQAISPEEVGGIISLGSFANVTDNLAWVEQLGHDLKPFLYDHAIPFFGICFAHQLLAHSCGAQVHYRSPNKAGERQPCKGFRDSQVLSLRFGILLAHIENADYQSGNDADLAFQTLARMRPQENALPSMTNGPGKHSAHNFLATRVPTTFTAEARHEQEVLNLSDASPLTVAATRADCAIEALVHRTLPIFSMQCHPETAHPSHDGWRILKNFIYFSALQTQSPEPFSPDP